MKSTIAIALLAALASPSEAFWRHICPGKVVQERADPIVNPGEVSGHVHTVSGGSAFSFNMTYETARTSQCSSCSIKQDLSNYWTPKLYYKDSNGSFSGVPHGGMTVYYLNQRSGPNNDKIKAFPEGFRMVAGNPFKRHLTTDHAGQAISYTCLSANGAPTYLNIPEFPKGACSGGLRAQVFFPSCWDGKNLDSDDHKSHVSYPTVGTFDAGSCPPTYPVHLVSIFYEIVYSTDQFEWHNGQNPFVWANGDATGYGLHGDFLNGWDVPTLQLAVDNCDAESGVQEDCPYFKFFTDDEANACSIPSFVDEDIEGPMQKLPGCNAVTSGPLDVTPVARTTCDDNGVIGQAQTFFVDLTKSKDWQYVGCGTDSLADRTFAGKREADDAMTVEKCVDLCSAAGFTYAGLEWSRECYCDNSLAANRAPVPGIMGDCSMTCSGDSKEYCGGSRTLSIYKKCTAGNCQNSQFSGSSSNTTSSASKRHLDIHRHHAHGLLDSAF